MLVLWYGRDFITQGYGDFTSFYAAGKLVQRRQGAQLYDPSSQWEVQQEFASSVRIRRHALPYIRPPFEALLFVPFSYLPYAVACAFWMVFKLLILCLSLFLLRRALSAGTISSIPTPLLAFFCLAASPVAFDLLQGQDAILLLFVLTLVLIALLERRPLIAGMLLAVGLFKFHLVIPLLIIVVMRRKFRFLAGFLIVAAGLLLLSAAIVGWGGILSYPNYLWQLTRSPFSGIMPPEIMPNLNGLISSVSRRWGGHGYVDWLALLILIGGIILVSMLWKQSDDSDRKLEVAGFCLYIVTVIPTSYYLSGYDMALLLLPILLMGDRLLSRQFNGWTTTAFVVCNVALLFIPTFLLLNLPVRRAYWMPLFLTALIPTVAYMGKAVRTPLVDTVKAMQPAE